MLLIHFKLEEFLQNKTNRLQVNISFPLLGSFIGAVAARFEGALEYTVDWSGDGAPPIGVSPEGMLTLRTLLDYEKQIKFTIEVSAFPLSEPELSTSTIVIIEVCSFPTISYQFLSLLLTFLGVLSGS